MTRRPGNKRWQPWMTGLVAVVLTVFGFYLGFSKQLPFTGNGYEISGIFTNAQQIRVKSPVRIAGVNVGKVTEVDHLTTDGEGQQAAVVKMELKDDALPLRQDATMEIRPRLFLEGNLFVDVHPGSPAAPELKDGSTVPIAQTSTSVQLDQVLTSLQAPVRAGLQTFLIEFGNALDKYGGGAGLQETFRSSPTAFKSTAEVNEALLGTQPGDLTGLVVDVDSLFRALNQNQPELQDLVTNLGTVLNSFGREDQALETAIFTLPELLGVGKPALVKLNSALPQLRAFAREALPGVRASEPALKAANPFLAQLRGLVRPGELRGLVSDLVPTVPVLAKLSQDSLPFLEQTRGLSSCFNNVIIPWSNSTVPASDGTPTAQVYKDTGYALAGLGGESRSGDANGEWIRTGLTAGINTVILPQPDGVDQFGVIGNLLGAQPALDTSAKTPFNPDAPCENQDPPNLAATVGAPPTIQTAANRDADTTADLLDSQTKGYIEDYLGIYNDIQQAQAGGGPEAATALGDAMKRLRQYNKTDLPKYRASLGGDK